MQLSPDLLGKSLSRYGHVAVEHRGRILVWGGKQISPAQSCNPEEVLIYDTNDLAWRKQGTTGDTPHRSCFAMAHVVGSELFVLCGYNGSSSSPFSNDVYSLDLVSWRWKEIQPAGQRPARCHGATSWVSGGSIFVFGGIEKSDESGPRRNETVLAGERIAVTDRFVAYDTVNNSWWWPQCGGPVPSPRYYSAAMVVGSKAYVLGGMLEDGEESDDLHRLDMDTWKWEEIKTGGIDNEDGGKSLHTLTLLGTSAALLYGGDDECWMLLLEDHRWIRCRYLERGSRSRHRAVAVEGTGQIWIIGGNWGSLNPVLRLPAACPLPLKHLAVKTLADNRDKVTTTIEDWPKKFKDLFHAFVKMEEVENGMQR